MNIDYQTLVALVLLPLLGFFLKAQHSAITKNAADISALQIHLPTYYVQKAELKDVLERMYGELVEIKKELRNKEDKV